MTLSPTLEETLMLYLNLSHPNPMPARHLYNVGTGHGFPEAEVLGMIGDLIAKDKILCKPDATHGAVYVLPD